MTEKLDKPETPTQSPQPSADPRSLSEIGDEVQLKSIEWMRKIAKEQPNYQVPY